ncbi:MAG: carboxymuconolactone decarboxylase family protein [Anaerolineae bacterium]|jgi:alkylhydroperoxidase/carboxymuconolactone decarboxylase family protein YurZ|nr:carboxymuconolactone decarboxylase family protein [Anaerolineae bacterium]MDH7474795.1 carboxymuconolactone decarboxylase family protein [Anaerolineae bacterium]
MNEHPLATMQKLDPEIVDHLRTTDQLIYADGALPKKFKLLMAMAFDAAHGAEGGVRALANAALREGATKEQIAEALRVAYYLAGVGALYIASRALKELVEET